MFDTVLAPLQEVINNPRVSTDGLDLSFLWVDIQSVQSLSKKGASLPLFFLFVLKSNILIHKEGKYFHADKT
jgi:hypothetical protein